MTPPRIERRLAAIMAADVAGYSRLMGIDEVGTLNALKEHRRERIDPTIVRHNGRVFKTTGDGLLVEFASVVDAVGCAVAIQRAMLAFNEEVHTDRQIVFRIGINVGDIILDGGDIFGDGVNVAARLETICEPGGVCISRYANEQVRDKLSLRFADLGEQTVKNIAHAIGVYGLTAKDIAALPEQALPELRPPGFHAMPVIARYRAMRAMVAGGGAIVALLITGLWWMTHDTPPKVAVAPNPVTSASEPTRAPASGSETLRLPDKPSIAVLRFTNLSGDLTQEYFSDGISDDLLTGLSRFRSLFVIAKSSSFAYESRGLDVKQVARELGARYALEGSVRKSADRIRISAQLADTIGGNQIWAEQYDRSIVDVFAVQDEITKAVLHAILPAIEQAERDRVMRKPPQSLSAWEAYQRGLWHVSRLSGADNEQAQRFFRQAIDQDPTLGRAYSELATTFNREVMALRMTPQDAVIVAEPLARKAVDLDDYDANAHIALSRVLLFQRGDYVEAMAEARRALELNPDLGLAHSAMGMALTFSGRPQQGLLYAQRGFILDPKNPSIIPVFHVMIASYFLRDYAGALLSAQTALRMYGPFGHTYYWLAAILSQLRRISEAQEALQKAITLRGLPYGITATGKRLPFMRLEDWEHELEGLRAAGWQG
jgi:adenylate cyclase